MKKYISILDFSSGDTFVLKLDKKINDFVPIGESAEEVQESVEDAIFNIIENDLNLDINNTAYMLSDTCPSSHTGGLKHYRLN